MINVLFALIATVLYSAVGPHAPFIAVFAFYVGLFLPAQLYMFGSLLRAMPHQVDAQERVLARAMRELESKNGMEDIASTGAAVAHDAHGALQRARTLQRRHGTLLYSKIKSSHFHV